MEEDPEDWSDNRRRYERVKAELLHDVTTSWADVVLLTACFIAGLVDSSVFNVWGCFASMQTGNSVYVGLGLSGQPSSQPYRWVKSGTAILSFCIGTLAFGRATRALGPLKRITLAASFLTQAIVCFSSAIFVRRGIAPLDASPWTDSIARLLAYLGHLIPLALLSFQSAGQIVASRTLEFNEIPTIVLTSTYCDLFIDPSLFGATWSADPRRNRRVLSIIMLILGAIAGGFVTRSGTIVTSLWIAGTIKSLIAIAWIFWPAAETSIRLI